MTARALVSLLVVLFESRLCVEKPFQVRIPERPRCSAPTTGLRSRATSSRVASVHQAEPQSLLHWHRSPGERLQALGCGRGLPGRGPVSLHPVR